jgi:hypothetical protein
MIGVSLRLPAGNQVALIATLTYSFARINAALNMKVEDLRPRGAGWTIRLHEKGRWPPPGAATATAAADD